MLNLFERFGIKTTWFIPGHSIETFPKQMRAVADAGHEIGIHGYSHENPIEMTREQETAVLDKCIELVTRLSGKRPTGYVAPWWEFSTVSNELLLERGIDADALLNRVGTTSEFHAPLMCDAPNGDSHGTHIRSFVVTVEEPIDWTAFGVWLTMLLNRHGDKVLRVKAY